MYKYVVASLYSGFVAACQLGRHVSERQPGIQFSASIPEAVGYLLAEYARLKMLDSGPLEFMVTPEKYAVITISDGIVISMTRLDLYLEQNPEVKHE